MTEPDAGPTPVDLKGATVWPGAIPPDAQAALVDTLRALVAQAPLGSYATPGGRRMSVRMSAAGQLGWVSDRSGYRYDTRHPGGSSWPPIPEAVLQIWRRYSGVSRLPDSCLINHYGEGARMALHQDRDEADLSWPVLSISLGDAGLFRIGGSARRDPTQSLWLQSGDVLRLSGAARLAHHGIDRIRFGSSTLLKGGGRLNLTLRIAA